MIRRWLAAFAIILLLTGCTLRSRPAAPPPSEPPQPPGEAGPGAPPGGSGAPPGGSGALPGGSGALPGALRPHWQAEPGISPEAFIREFFGALAAGRSVEQYPESGGSPTYPVGQIPFVWAPLLPRTAQAWEEAGLVDLSAPPVTASPSDPRWIPQILRRFGAADGATPRLLYLDQTARESKRYGALVHMEPMNAFLYLAFRQEGDRLIATRLVETQLDRFRRGPEADLYLLWLLEQGRIAELESHLLMPYSYLAAVQESGEQVTSLQRLLGSPPFALQVREGRLYANETGFALDWVQLPDGSYRVIGAGLMPEYQDPRQPSPQPVTWAPPPAVAEEAIGATALAFIRHWGQGDVAAAEAMTGDVARFYAHSLLSPSGRLSWPYETSFWSLAAEKARLDSAFDLRQPVDWTTASLARVSADPLPRAEVHFRGTGLLVDLYVTGPGQISSIALRYPWDGGRSGGPERTVLDRLPRLGDWERGERLLQALADGNWAGAAAAAGLSGAELEQVLDQEGDWAERGLPPRGREAWLAWVGQAAGAGARLQPAGPPPSYLMATGQAVLLRLGSLTAALAFTGPDQARRLAAIGFGGLEYTPNLSLGGSTSWMPGGIRGRQLWPEPFSGTLPLPEGDRLMTHPGFFDGPAESRLISFFQANQGEMHQVAQLAPPLQDGVWHYGTSWKRPGQPEWWMAFGSSGQRVSGLAQIRWDGAEPAIVAQYPVPPNWQGYSRSTDLDGDGTPEFITTTLVGSHPAVGHDLLLSWYRDGALQQRTYRLDGQWQMIRADSRNSRVVYRSAAHLITISFDRQTGFGEPKEIPTSFEIDPHFDSELLREQDGLIWWQQSKSLHWLDGDQIRTLPPGRVVGVGELTGSGQTQVLVAEPEPAALALYRPDGSLIWRQPWRYLLEPGRVAALTDEHQRDLVAHGRNPHDSRISRVMALRITDRGPLLLWQGPLLSRVWSVDLAVGDLDGSPLKEVYLILHGTKGYRGFQVYSDSTTPWGPPVLTAGRTVP